MTGDEMEVCRCAKCSRALQVVCPAGCENPDEALRKSKGPVPAEPRGERTYTPKPIVSDPEKLRQKEIGRTLRAAREKAGLSYEQLGAKVGRAPKSFGVWESGNQLIGPYLVLQLAKVLHIRESKLVNELHVSRRNGKQ
jgi:ribosome-binding protein aMBF1 (putative translation factor)